MDKTWEKINEVFCGSKYKITIFDGKIENGRDECYKLNIPYDSVLASVVMNCSGIIVDNWIKLLGQGSENTNGVLHYNTIIQDSCLDGMFIVAIDVVGGIFAINISRFSNEKNYIWYFAADTLEWECLSMKYADFVAWVAQGNINEFYESMRWINWENDCNKMEFNTCYLIYPFLWAKECDVNSATKKVILADELIKLNFDYAKKIKLF